MQIANIGLNPSNASLTKMVQHTQKIRWQRPKNCLSVSDHFVGSVLKGLTAKLLVNMSYCIIAVKLSVKKQFTQVVEKSQLQ